VSDLRLKRIATTGLVIGALLSIAGTFTLSLSFAARVTMWAVSLILIGVWAWARTRTERGEEGGRCGFPSGWLVAGLRDPSTFFQHVQTLLPPGALLVLDEGSMATEIREFVEAGAVEPQAELVSGTLWPRSRMHWLRPTTESLSRLAALSLNHASPEICDHLYAVHDGRLVLIWTDAFFDPLLISSEVSAGSVAAFGQAVQLQPEKWEGHLS